MFQIFLILLILSIHQIKIEISLHNLIVKIAKIQIQDVRYFDRGLNLCKRIILYFTSTIRYIKTQ